MVAAIDRPIRYKLAEGLAALAASCPLPNYFTMRRIADASKVSVADAECYLRMLDTRGAAGGLDVMYHIDEDEPDLVWVDRFSS